MLHEALLISMLSISILAPLVGQNDHRGHARGNIKLQPHTASFMNLLYRLNECDIGFSIFKGLE